MAQAVARRNELAVEYTWDLESIFPSHAAWESALNEAAEKLSDLDRFRGHLSEGPDMLVGVFSLLDEILSVAGKVFVYASMQHDADTADQGAAAMFDRAMGLYSQTMAAISFLDPELLAIGSSTLNEWVRVDSRLSTYEHYFERLNNRQKHVRSAEIEQILALTTNPFMTARQTHGVLADADLSFEPAVNSNGDKIAISQGNIDALLTDADREVRKTAFNHYADAHLAFKNTMANCIAGGVKQDVFNARVRNYSSSLEAALDPERIPAEVFHNLINTFRKNLPTWHKYWRLRRKALGYDTFHVYDIKAPVATGGPKVPYDQSVEWIREGMKPLGSDYGRVLERGMTKERWVDIYPNEGKRAGAYSGGWKGTYPFILMSYTDDIYSMSTLAHELGHSMHSYYSWETQPHVYAQYSTFVAEVASNFNQALVRNYLLQGNIDRDLQIALIEEAMSNFHRYFFIMPSLARFELEVHERAERDEPLTAEVLNSIMLELFREGYGDEVEIDPDRIGITWGEFPTHLYMNFYVFQYATGISAAQFLSKRVLTEGEPAAEQYLKFLRSGGSMYPVDALKLAGVDMTSPEPVDEAFALLNEMVERLGDLLGVTP